ncbi:MAG: hypothetical protein BGO76_02485 [Caedibacter sp. 38-128]|nr:MAG: hypothetical protein BGO76_02485 [Caedibacter sp. 38-128]
MIYFLFIPSLNCCASDAPGKEEESKRIIPKIITEEEWEMMIPKKAFPSPDNEIKKSTLKELMLSLQDGLLELHQTPRGIIEDFSFATRTFRKVPQLHLIFEHEDFNWLASNGQDNQAPHLYRAGVECLEYVYGQQLTFSYLEYNYHSLGGMMLYFYGIGIQGDNNINFKFNEIECLFAYTYKEVFSYMDLAFRNKRISDASKITDIQKAMCLRQVPVIVALFLSENIKKNDCKILILYDFDNETQLFKAKDLQSTKVKVPYMAIQLFALEAWIGYNSMLITSSQNLRSINLI